MLRLSRTPNSLAQFYVLRDYGSFMRLHFLHCALQSGLLQALRTPTSKAALAQRLNVARPDLLDLLLRLGVSLRELSRQGGLYKIRGRRSLALVGKHGDPLAAFVEEYVTYHASVHLHLGERLAG